MAMRSHISCDHAVALSETLHPNSVVSPALAAWANRDDAYPVFLRHLEDCVTCRVSVGVKRRIRETVPEVSDELQQRRLLDEVIAVARSESNNTDGENVEASVHTGHPLRRLFIGIAAGFLILAGAGLGILWHAISAEEGKHTDKSLSMPVTPTGEMGRLNDTTAVGKERQERPRSLDGLWAPGHGGDAGDLNVDGAGNIHVALAQGVDAMLDGGSQIKVLETAPNVLRVKLVSGRMLTWVNPAVPHPVVEIETPQGVVTVKGTVFSVNVSATVDVSVLKGVVAVAVNEETVFIRAGSRMTIGETVTELSRTERSVLRRAFNDIRSKKSPSSEKRSTKQRVLAESPRTKKSGEAPHDEGRQGRASRRMSEARTLRNQQNWMGARDAYEEVIALVPNSDSAASAMIAAGNIRLRLGDGGGALNHFNRYLSLPQRSLRQEAMLGKIKAFRQLGDVSKERAAIAQFIAAYPDAIHVSALQQRMGNL